MGILPLQFVPGQGADELGLTGRETMTIRGLGPIGDGLVPPTLTVTADDITFEVKVRLDTGREADYYRHGGIMPYVLRGLMV
ncbi:hypothetical protein ACIBO2_12215 [Nonomuraea sp. NPDC050022]|uniref:hypothetical protein n=1 Tax=unclassified Nonomuraea TaxID=2593643 RepID=UPI0033E86C64